MPFGGTKSTGNGHREGGTQVLDIFSEWKAVYVDYSGKLQRAQIDIASRVRRFMIVGLPKEVKDNEYRVGLVPAGVKALTSGAHGAGADSRGRRFGNHRSGIRDCRR